MESLFKIVKAMFYTLVLVAILYAGFLIGTFIAIGVAILLCFYVGYKIVIMPRQ
jgi:hypothetical protein|tara:strand:+ start:250 stop:411 length:162 start_codon:yes stop_codon:yes gene_type:complete